MTHPFMRAVVATIIAAAGMAPGYAHAFCGFFVGRAGAELFNSASQVVIVHDDGKTVLTMVNDFRGDLRDFALVVPVPVVLEEGVVRVADMDAVDHLDAYTAPRLAEYHDPNPCALRHQQKSMRALAPRAASGNQVVEESASSDAVQVEASYTVGEYDIVVLSARESNALETWLRSNDYNIPKGASNALRPYVRSGMKFFVARVNLDVMAAEGFQKLRPLQFGFPDPRFMLPVRLGMLNAAGPQDLIAYVITKQYRVEPANYRSVQMPSDVNVPTFVRDAFAQTYRAIFDHEVEKTQGRAVFTEYAWNMAWCDPCAADPLSTAELEALGVWWLGSTSGAPTGTVRRSAPAPARAFVTRLHARYTEATFPEDLVLKVTADGSNRQVRYVLQNPYLEPVACEAAAPYFASVQARREAEIDRLASLTGWAEHRVRDRMDPLPPHFGASPEPPDPSFLDRIRGWFDD